MSFGATDPWPASIHVQDHREWITFGPCHGKTCLKIFVFVIPKEGLAFGMTANAEYNLYTAEYNFIVSVISKESLGMTTTKILRHDFL